MVTQLKPYPAYKSSGVEWLGDVPAHWEVKRLKQICRMEYGDSLVTDVRRDGRISVFGSNGCVGLHNVANTEAPCIIVGRKGSFGKVHYSTTRVFVIDTAFFVDKRTSSTHIRWLYYLLGSLHLDEITKDSAVPGMNRTEAYQRLGPLPPLPEQAAIARFLDDMDRRITRYIAAKKRLIALLEEYRRVLVSDAVTGRFDVRTGKPYPAYKPSGVKWLGDVPAHWGVARTKSVVSILNGATPSTSNPSYWDGDILWLTPDDLGSNKGVRVRSSSRKITQAGYDSCGTSLAPRDSIVISTRAPIGHIAILDQLGCVNQGCRLLALGDGIDSSYIYFLLLSARQELQSLGVGTTFNELPRTRLESFPLTVPPLSEQTAIARFLDGKTEKVQARIAQAQGEIDLLREYRTRLIADVVTGKLDVRNAAAELPEAAAVDEDGVGAVQREASFRMAKERIVQGEDSR